MEPRGMLNLPVELIHHIGSYLSVEDVWSFSLVCLYLKNALNYDSLWRNHLPNEYLSSLEDLEHQVSPGFEEDKSMCKNKWLYGRKNHLINNWKRGCFAMDTVRTKQCYWNIKVLFYKTRYLFHGLQFKRADSNQMYWYINVWDIENIPACKYTVVPPKITLKDHYSFYIFESYLVLVQCCVVYVHQIKLPDKTFPMVYSFIITEENVTLNEFLDHRCPSECTSGRWSHSLVDKFLLSINNSIDEDDLYVWDILSGSKVGCFVPPIGWFSLTHQCDYDNGLLLGKTLQGNSCFYFTINVEKQEFSKRIISCTGDKSRHEILYNNHLILFENFEPYPSEDPVCIVFDINTFKELKNRSFNNARRTDYIDLTKVVNGKLVILCFDGFQVIDALTLETIDYFECNDVTSCLREVNIFGSVFVFTAKSNGTVDVWDIQSKKTFPLGKLRLKYLYFNKLFTKVVFEDRWNLGLSVLHFW